MDTSTTTTAPSAGPTRRHGSVLRAATIGAIVATVVNVALWGIGRATEASFIVDPALGDPNLEVGAIKVIFTTLLPLAAGAVLLALAARRSRRSVRGLAAAAAVFAVVSAAGPLEGGHDTGTGILLATMHLTTGAAYLLVAAKVARESG